jgi:hypothetical protein
MMGRCIKSRSIQKYTRTSNEREVVHSIEPVRVNFYYLQSVGASPALVAAVFHLLGSLTGYA